jgi:hypothetical protein
MKLQNLQEKEEDTRPYTLSALTVTWLNLKLHQLMKISMSFGFNVMSVRNGVKSARGGQ